MWLQTWWIFSFEFEITKKFLATTWLILCLSGKFNFPKKNSNLFSGNCFSVCVCVTHLSLSRLCSNLIRFFFHWIELIDWLIMGFNSIQGGYVVLNLHNSVPQWLDKIHNDPIETSETGQWFHQIMLSFIHRYMTHIGRIFFCVKIFRFS